MKKATTILTALLFFVCCQAQTANEPASFIRYSTPYQYGINQGYYPGWSAQATMKLVSNVKGNTLRIPLYDDFFSLYGTGFLLPDINYAKSLGMTDLLAFVGHPSPGHRDSTIYGSNTEPSYSFKGLYEPIWLDSVRTIVNPANIYAHYLYDVVSTYGPYFKFWEIVNEPDFTYSPAGYLGDQDPGNAKNWYHYNPQPEELANLRAPLFHYIRMLRISWEVIKKLQPSSYVCTGGIGYRDFLDALLRNTDNPDSGKVTAAYPLKAGAYFDILSFHTYPMYDLKFWNNATGSVQYTRHSDAAIQAHLTKKRLFDSILIKWGYNGITYPKKQFICTETNVSTIMNGTDWGSDSGATNYLLKNAVLSQKNGILQTWIFKLGNDAGTDQFSNMGLYCNLDACLPGAETLTNQGVAYKALTNHLAGSVYDSVATTRLNIPASCDGAAFKKANGSYVYALWAKTTTDMTEAAHATMSLPACIRTEWNGATSSTTNPVQLTGTPSFFEPVTILPIEETPQRPKPVSPQKKGKYKVYNMVGQLIKEGADIKKNSLPKGRFLLIRYEDGTTEKYFQL